jgi:hypothetical protein
MKNNEQLESLPTEAHAAHFGFIADSICCAAAAILFSTMARRVASIRLEIEATNTAAAGVPFVSLRTMPIALTPDAAWPASIA